MISLSLKTLDKVLGPAKDEFITELFSRKGETLSKRARFESSAPEVELVSAVDVKRVNCDKLAFLLFRRLRDSRWEVRDSTLEFVESLLRLNNSKLIRSSGFLSHFSLCCCTVMVILRFSNFVVLNNLA